MERYNHRSCSAWLKGAAAIIASAVMAWGAWAEELPAQLVIGYQRIPNPETVAKDLGWHEKKLGIPVKWILFDSGKHVNEAVASGRVDVGLVGSSPCAAGISRGIPMEVVWIHDIIGDNEALAVRKNSGIEKINDLVGKRVAVPFGSTTHYHLMVALKLANIETARVDIIDLEPPKMSDAWIQGRIDAAFVWEPVLSKLLADGGKLLLTSRQLAERGFPTADLCVVRKEFATTYPSVVVGYLKSLDRAVRLYRSAPEKAASAVARQLGVSPDEAAREMQGLILLTGEEQLSGKYVGEMNLNFGLYTLLKNTADFLEQAGEIQSSPSWPVFMRAVSASYVQKVIVRKEATLVGPRPRNESEE